MNYSFLLWSQISPKLPNKSLPKLPAPCHGLYHHQYLVSSSYFFVISLISVNSFSSCLSFSLQVLKLLDFSPTPLSFPPGPNSLLHHPSYSSSIFVETQYIFTTLSPSQGFSHLTSSSLPCHSSSTTPNLSKLPQSLALHATPHLGHSHSK